MKVGRYAYNALNAFVRGVEKHMSTILISVAMGSLPIAIVLYIWGSDHNNNIAVISAGCLAVTGFVAWSAAYISWNKEIKKKDAVEEAREARHKELIAELKGFREDMRKK